MNIWNFYITYASNVCLNFKCPEQKHEFKKVPYNFDIIVKNGCPICNNPKLLNKKTFFEQVPLGKAWWNFEKNSKEFPNLDPFTVMPFSGKRVNFCCENGHSFYKKIREFTLNPRCSACEQREKSISAKAPWMLYFWDYEKNTLIPDEVTPFSKELIHWRCPKCSTTWIRSPAMQVNSKKCIACEMKRTHTVLLQPGESFKDARPDVSKNWDFEKIET